MSCESFIVRDVFVERLESKSGLDNPRIVMGIVVAAIRYSMMKYSIWALLFFLFGIFERTWRTVLLVAMVKQCSQDHISSIDAVPLSADWRFSKMHSWQSSFKHDHITTWDKIRYLSRGLLVAIGKREKILSSWPNRKDLKHSSTVALGHIGDNTHVAFAVMSLIHLKTFFSVLGHRHGQLLQRENICLRSVDGKGLGREELNQHLFPTDMPCCVMLAFCSDCSTLSK